MSSVGFHAAEADRGAVARRDARRTMEVVGRALVEGQTGTQRPFAVQLVGGTDGIDRVMPVLLFDDGRRVALQRARNSVVLDDDRFEAAPAGPHGTAVQRPLVVEFVRQRDIHRLWRVRV